MKLLLDQGNTNLRWAAVEGGNQIVTSGVVSADRPLGDVLRSLPDVAAASFSSVLVSSVASNTRNRELSEVVVRTFGSEPKFLAAMDSLAGLKNGYRDATRLGCDRWLTMLGARTIQDGPLLVVDAGSAVTVDAVRRSGEHLGGFIVPGYELQCHALTTGTAGVGVAIATPERGWGRDTQTAVVNGVVLALAALIDRSLRELRQGVDETVSLVLTGGDAHRIAPCLESHYLLDEILIFRGMIVQMAAAG